MLRFLHSAFQEVQMSYSKPDYLKQGEPARLFPVLSVTSKEGRTTSIFLACFARVDEFCASLLGSVGKRIGQRSTTQSFTEIVFPDEPSSSDRPDGLIVVNSGGKEWRALVEAKVANADLDAKQVESYRQIARTHNIDCVITISNQFTSDPANHPLENVRASRSKIPVFHWSWMSILTVADLLVNNETIEDEDQRHLLIELRRFLRHESAGVKGFGRMPPEWPALNRLVSSGGKIPVRSVEGSAVLDAWHQETRDLSLVLSRLTEAAVTEKLSRKHLADPAARHKDELSWLCERHQIRTVLQVPDAAAPIDVVADLARRTVDVGMTLRAPEDKKTSKARINWLLRQIKAEDVEHVYVRLNWPGSSPSTQFGVTQLRTDPGVVENDKGRLQVTSFHVFSSKRLGARFAQRTNFIADLEAIVPEFYSKVGGGLSVWKRSPPQIKPQVEDDDNADLLILRNDD